MLYLEKTSLSAAQTEADALWQKYREREWAARGLPAGSSLDRNAATGEIVAPITVRVCEPVVVDASTVLVPVDDDAKELTPESKTAKAESALSAKAKAYLVAERAKSVEAVAVDEGGKGAVIDEEAVVK